MTEFLLEIYGEEIPSWAQRQAEKNLKTLMEEFLIANKVSFLEIETNSSSRRISLLINKIEKQTSENISEIRGPSCDANQIAIEGFLKKNKSKISDLVKKTIKKKKYYFLIVKSKRLEVSKILVNNLPIILGKIKWKRSMRWNIFNEKWVRPIKNILCIFNNKKIAFKYGGVMSCNFTYGNYSYGEKKILIKNVKDYKKSLEKYRVILSREKRQKIISQKLQSFCKSKKVKLIENNELFERVADSVEYPNIFFGKFSEKYFKLPEFLLKSVMFDKQDYFCFLKNNSLLNSFAFISSKDISKKKYIVKGNENVLKARFSDAKFFIEEDKKKN